VGTQKIARLAAGGRPGSRSPPGGEKGSLTPDHWSITLPAWGSLGSLTPSHMLDAPLLKAPPTNKYWLTAPELLGRGPLTPTTWSTARLMPRRRSIGFMPAATLLQPSFRMARASTVAVVVPARRGWRWCGLGGGVGCSPAGIEAHAPPPRIPATAGRRQIAARASNPGHAAGGRRARVPP